MNCDEVQQLLEAYLDGELTLSDRRDIDLHISECKSCLRQFENLQKLQIQIRSVQYQPLPAALKGSIENSLRDITGEPARRSELFRWISIGGGSMITGVLATWLVMTVLLISPASSQIADSVINMHINSLLADHITDVRSTDRHTVKPWFNGRIGFAPPVKTFEPQGYQLMGGRLDYLDGQTVSALVYKRRAHVINLFVLKNNHPSDTRSTASLQRHGYNLVSWHKEGLAFWLISDLNKKELMQFAALTQK